MSFEENLVAVVLAAGQGTRMKSDIAKVLHSVCGKSMIKYVVEAVDSLSPSRIILIVGHQAADVIEEIKGDRVEFAMQSQRLGTGHAMMQACPLLKGFSGTVMVLTGDTPLLRPATLQSLLEHHRREGASATVLSAKLDDAKGYGRILKDADGNFLKIVEHRDASEDEKKVKEINSGIFCFESDDLFSALDRIDRKNIQGEYYLTDVMGILRNEGKKTAVHLLCGSSDEVMGINDIEQLRKAERLMRING